MPAKAYLAALLLLGGLMPPVLAAELSTLFTTPEERALIDRNRYKSAETETESQQSAEDSSADWQLETASYDSVTREYLITGITVSRAGPPMVWINSVAYEDGARLDDDSRVEVLDGDQIRVRITAPDGKHYYASSGETLKISYLARTGDRP